MASRDQKYMQWALDLAATLGSDAHPNPRVGALVVKGGRVLGLGAHERYGGPHAEINALRAAGTQTKGATLYVTLEPCSHYGKTPPCVEAILESGVREVVAAGKDPNPLVSGRGLAILKRSGIRVRSGVLSAEAEALNEAHFHANRAKRPLVILKAAITLDGRITTDQGKSQWITGASARLAAHQLRSQCDAILVGSGTLEADNPSLAVRAPGWKRRDGFPFRVLLDTGLSLKPSAKILKGDQGTLVFCGPRASQAKERALQKAGAQVLRVGLRKGRLSLPQVLQSLLQNGVKQLLVEGGAEVHGAFLREKLADRVVLFMAPKLLGGDPGKSWFAGVGWGDPNHCPTLEDVRVRPRGRDLEVSGRIKYD